MSSTHPSDNNPYGHNSAHQLGTSSTPYSAQSHEAQRGNEHNASYGQQPYDNQQSTYSAPGVNNQPSPYSASHGGSQAYGASQTYGAGYGDSYGTPYGEGYGQGYNTFSKPRPHVGYGQAHKNWFKYMFHFSGRASRSEYWWVQLTINIAILIPTFLTLFLFFGALASTDANGNISDTGMGALLGALTSYILIFVVALVILVMTLGLGWRRMQDAGFPGWLYLLNFAGLSIVPFVLSFFPSKPEGYQYDKPKDYDRP